MQLHYFFQYFYIMYQKLLDPVLQILKQDDDLIYDLYNKLHFHI